MAVMDALDLREVAAELGPQYAVLRQAAEMYADHQAHRIRATNQIKSLTVTARDYEFYAESLSEDEKRLSRALVRAYRATVPVGVIEWQQATLGIGEHMLARLLGQLGHPRLAIPKHWARNSTIGDDEWGNKENPKRLLVAGEPYLRTLSQLRSYCGHGEARQRRKGMTQEEAFGLGNPGCKMLVHLLAEGVVKAQIRSNDDIVAGSIGTRYARGPLGQFYLDTRARYEERGHSGPCPGGPTVVNGRALRIRCKVDGRYAEAGDPFQPSHVNAIALRHLGKRILEELYDAAREEWCQ